MFRGFCFDCEVAVAVNPRTFRECKLTPPVKIRSFEDFARFNDEWATFCEDIGGDPGEVCFPFDCA